MDWGNRSVRPTQILRWFHTQQSDRTVLCLLVGASLDARSSIERFLKNLYEFDAALGPRVSFFFIHPETETSDMVLDSVASDRAVSAAATSRDPPVRVQPLRSLAGTQGLSDEQVKHMSAAAAAFAPELAQVFGVEFAQMPALCITAKFHECVNVVPLTDSLSERDLLVFLSKLASAAQHDDGGHPYRYDFVGKLPGIVTELLKHERDAKDAVLKVRTKLDALCDRFGPTNEDASRAQAFLDLTGRKAVPIDEALKEFSFASNIERHARPSLQSAATQLNIAKRQLWDGLALSRSDDLLCVRSEIDRILRRNERIDVACAQFAKDHGQMLRLVSPPGAPSWAALSQNARDLEVLTTTYESKATVPSPASLPLVPAIPKVGKRRGLQRVSGTHNDSRALDLVFVHGLGGDAWATWMANANDPNSFWPYWLASAFPQIGLWTLGYASSPSKWVEESMPIGDRGVQVLDLLVNAGFGNRPLAFVTHSMGGIVAKQILRSAETLGVTRYERISNQTVGIAFIATPHSGANIANFALMASLLLRTNEHVSELRAHASRLRELHTWFLNKFLEGRTVVCRTYCETREVRPEMPLLSIRLPKGIVVVDQTSAEPNIRGEVAIPLDEDHLSICKPLDGEAQIYTGVKAFVDECLARRR